MRRAIHLGEVVRWVVRTEAAHRVRKLFVPRVFDWIQSSKDHRLRPTETRERGLRIAGRGESVADASLVNRLHAKSDAADLARPEPRQHMRAKWAHQVNELDAELRSARRRFYLVPNIQGAIEHLHETEHAKKVVIPRVEQ